QEIQSPGDVDLIGFARQLNRLGNGRHSGLMKNIFDSVDSPRAGLGIGDRAFNQFDLLDPRLEVGAASRREIVQYSNFRALPDQRLNEVRTNETRATRDQIASHASATPISDNQPCPPPARYDIEPDSMQDSSKRRPWWTHTGTTIAADGTPLAFASGGPSGART